MRPLHEWLYFLNENEKKVYDIIADITEHLRNLGKKAIKNQTRQRIRVYEKIDSGYSIGVQFIVYKNVLIIYKNLLDNETSTKWDYYDIKRICKSYPPTTLAISISYMSDDYLPIDEELRKTTVRIMKAYLGTTLKEDYVRRTIECPSH